MAVDIGYRAGTITASFNLLFALTLPLSGLTTWSSGHSSHFWINAFVSCNGQLGMVVIIYLHHRHVRKEALESWCTHALGLPAAFLLQCTATALSVSGSWQCSLAIALCFSLLWFLCSSRLSVATVTWIAVSSFMCHSALIATLALASIWSHLRNFFLLCAAWQGAFAIALVTYVGFIQIGRRSHSFTEEGDVSVVFQTSELDAMSANASCTPSRIGTDGL